jgi:hypothetical protein
VILIKVIYPITNFTCRVILKQLTVRMGSKIGNAPKGLMEDTEYGMYMEGAPLGKKRTREVLGVSLR